jgi:hypothetical protein
MTPRLASVNRLNGHQVIIETWNPGHSIFSDAVQYFVGYRSTNFLEPVDNSIVIQCLWKSGYNHRRAGSCWPFNEFYDFSQKVNWEKIEGIVEDNRSLPNVCHISSRCDSSIIFNPSSSFLLPRAVDIRKIREMEIPDSCGFIETVCIACDCESMCSFVNKLMIDWKSHNGTLSHRKQKSGFWWSLICWKVSSTRPERRSEVIQTDWCGKQNFRLIRPAGIRLVNGVFQNYC